MKHPTSLRISDYTTAQIQQLRARIGANQTEIVALAVDRMYRQEFGKGANPMKQQQELQELRDEFGTATFEGKTYTLTRQADFSNRLFPGWWGDAEEGDEYTVEFTAGAVDDEGNEYMVYWQFADVKGQEPEDLDSYPFDDEHVTRVDPQ